MKIAEIGLYCTIVASRVLLRGGLLFYNLHFAHSNSPIRPPYVETDDLPWADVRLPGLVALQTDLVRIEEYVSSLSCFNEPVPCFRVEFRNASPVVLPFDLDRVLMDNLYSNSGWLRFSHVYITPHAKRKVNNTFSPPRLLDRG